MIRFKTAETERADASETAGVSIAGVSASYGDRRVLNGFDLDVAPGSFVALAGPNGVGKSTLLRLIAGVLKPTAGSVRVGGRDIRDMTARERARLVAMVPQNPELPVGATALEVALMGRNPHLGLLSWESAGDVDIAIEALRMTDSEDFLDRAVDELSGGERQRVAIAMALAQQTPVILLDEPTANLDLAYQPAMMGLMRRMAAEGKTIVAAVHDLTIAAQFCDRVALISEGSPLAVGAPQEALTAENIMRAYGADVRILEHPDTGKPVVVNAWKLEETR